MVISMSRQPAGVRIEAAGLGLDVLASESVVNRQGIKQDALSCKKNLEF